MNVSSNPTVAPHSLLPQLAIPARSGAEDAAGAVGWRSPVAGPGDIEAIEARPYDEVVPVRSMIGLIERAAMLYPDRPALTYLPDGSAHDEPEILSYRDFHGRVMRAANGLRRLGIGEQDGIALLMPTIPDTFVALFAAQLCSRVCPINYMLSAEKVADLIDHARARVLIVLGPDEDLQIWEKVERIRDLSPGLRHVIVAGARVAGVSSFEDLVEQAPAQLEFSRDLDRGDVAACFHTGGTTGSPKLVVHTHGNEVHASWFGGLFYGIGPEDTVVNGFPLFHVAGAFVLGGSAFAAGANTLIPSKLGMRNKTFVKDFWRIAERHGVTLISGGPTFVSTLVDGTGEPAGAACKVKALVGGGSPMPNELARAFEARFGIPLRSIYGMTEASGLVAIVPRLAERVPGSSGWRLPYSEIATFKQDAEGGPDFDCPLPSGKTGAIAIRGPNLSPGYSDPARNIGTFADDGWVITGDLGHLSEDGQVFVTGRAKDVIIRGGHNIDPAAIEEALMHHPDVQLCAAVGEPDAYAGELPVVFVQPRTGTAPSQEDILGATAALIPERAAVPKRVHLVDTLPLTTTGKIYKPELRMRAAELAFAAQLQALLPAGALTSVQCDDAGGGRTVRIRLSGRCADETSREIVYTHMSRFSFACEVVVE